LIPREKKIHQLSIAILVQKRPQKYRFKFLSIIPNSESIGKPKESTGTL